MSGEAGERTRIGDASLSRICLGTMRLDRVGDAAAAGQLIGRARDLGISSLHCSSEYETFPLFREALAAAGTKAGSVVAKVATPHFGEDSFSGGRFRDKVEAYLSALRIERLDVVQWLLRSDLKQEERRLRILDDAEQEIAATVEALKREGKIGALVSFPYTASLADRVIDRPWCDGLAVYVNPLERELDAQIIRAGEAGKRIIAIRPYAAGRLFSETSLGVDDALAHVFGFDGVASTVVSVSSDAHLDALRAWT